MNVVSFFQHLNLATLTIAFLPLVGNITGEILVEKPQPAIADTERLKKPGPILRLASYNIQDFSDGIDDGARRTPERAAQQARLAARILDDVDPDVLVLQEIENATALRLLNEHLEDPFPLGYVTALGDGGARRERLNLAVLSRVPLEDLRELDFGPLRGRGRPTRGALGFSVDLGDGHRLLVYTVHLKSNFGETWVNRRQRYNALRYVRRDADQVMAARRKTQWSAVLVCDMNVDPELDPVRNDFSLRPFGDWVDLFRGRPMRERTTLPTRYGDPRFVFPPSCFDRFFVTTNLMARPWITGTPRAVPLGVDTNVFTQGGENDIHVSDHYPVFLDLLR